MKLTLRTYYTAYKNLYPVILRLLNIIKKLICKVMEDDMKDHVLQIL
jgi:hypothetical protein